MDEPRPSDLVPKPVDPVDPERELAGRNTRFGLALFGLSLLLFAGVWAVAFIYLALD
jgi:hypothetical protein